jgi:hypothetical protein
MQSLYASVIHSLPGPFDGETFGRKEMESNQEKQYSIFQFILLSEAQETSFSINSLDDDSMYMPA